MLLKYQEEVKQNVLRQTGKIFQNFDEAVKTGILGELADEELVPVRTETFLQEDEVEEAIWVDIDRVYDILTFDNLKTMWLSVLEKYKSINNLL